MPELRKDPVIGRWVIIATERAKRPHDYIQPKEERGKRDECPFCPGNEDKTPPEILAFRRDGTPPNSPGWTLRVVANKFPALTIYEELRREGDGVYDRMSGVGAHEVIIESPNHEETPPNFPLERFRDILWAYRERILDLKKDRRFRYILIFKNHGVAAGASLEHPHSQLIALPIVPRLASEELYGSKIYYDYRERCVYCDMIRQDLSQGIRVISQNEHCVAISPFAARFPFETWILPKSHQAAYETSSQEQIFCLALSLSDVLKRLDSVLSSPPYNLLLHCAPLGEENLPYYHWHCELMPILTRVAGFEWGTGFYINPTPPEDAARYLREAEI